MTTPKSNPSKHYKHFRKAVAFRFRMLELCRHCRFRAGSFSELSPRIQFWHICHVDRHGHFTLKQLRLPVLNETHTNIYTGPRLGGGGIREVQSLHIRHIHHNNIIYSYLANILVFLKPNISIYFPLTNIEAKEAKTAIV